MSRKNDHSSYHFRFRCVGHRFVLVRLFQKNKHKKHNHTDCYGHIGHVENRPACHIVAGKIDEKKMKGRNMNVKKFEIKKINDLPKKSLFV